MSISFQDKFGYSHLLVQMSTDSCKLGQSDLLLVENGKMPQQQLGNGGEVRRYWRLDKRGKIVVTTVIIITTLIIIIIIILVCRMVDIEDSAVALPAAAESSINTSSSVSPSDVSTTTITAGR